jgi:multiple sugar transport system substrate-binding protein
MISRRKVLKGFGLGAAGAAASLVLSACSTSTPPASPAAQSTGGTAASPTPAAAKTSAASTTAPAPTAAPQQQSVKLRWSTWNTGGLLTMDKDFINGFTKGNPTIQVEVINAPSDYSAKLLSQAASGSLSDVIHIAADYYPALVNAKVLLDVTSYFSAAQFDYSKYVPFGDIFRPGGHIIGGLQDYSKVYPLFYNADVFSQANLPTPYDLWKKGEWTWDGFRQTAKQLTKNGVWGAYAYNSYETGWSPWVYAIGATDWIVPTEKYGAQVHFDSPKVQQATQFQIDLVYKDQVSAKPGQIATVGGADPFTAGKVAMITNGNWVLADYPNLIGTRFKWGVAPVPTPTGKDFLTMFNPGAHGMVTSHTKYPEQAFALSLHFLSQPVQDTLAKIHTLLPVLASSYKSANFTASPAEHIDVVETIASNSQPIPVFLSFDEVTNRLQSDLDNAFLNKVSVDQALKTAQQDAEAIIAKQGQ